VRTDRGPDIGVGAGDLLSDGPVGRVIVLAAQPVVVNPRHVRLARIEPGTLARWLMAARHLAAFRDCRILSG
jgi:hypothetical protein